MNDRVLDILKSPSRRSALRYFFSTGGEVTGRGLARRIGFSHQQALNALGQLAELGVLERRELLPSYLFRLVDTPLTAALRAALAD